MVIAYKLSGNVRKIRKHLRRKVKYVNADLKKHVRYFRTDENGKIESKAYGGLNADKTPKARSFKKAIKKQKEQTRARRAARTAPAPAPVRAAPAQTRVSRHSQHVRVPYEATSGRRRRH